MNGKNSVNDNMNGNMNGKNSVNDNMNGNMNGKNSLNDECELIRLRQRRIWR